MCILSFFPDGVGADVEALTNGGLCNPHGHGWAIVTGDLLIVGKSMDLGEAVEGFAAARAEHIDGPALFHSRWATHGSHSVENCHPFIVGGDARTVVAHNGILPREAHPGPGDDRSDTRLFADELLPTRFRRLDRRRAFDALGRWCGPGNKLVILTVNPRYRHRAYLVNAAAGQWDTVTGVWHSNGDYLCDYRWGTTTGWDYDEYETGADGLCVRCQGAFIGAGGFCEDCWCCQDCGDERDECQCYGTWWRTAAVDAAMRGYDPTG